MSDTYWLVAIEVAHIQSYIFSSNRLRENVGASELVALATGDWAYEAVMEAVGDGYHTIKKNDRDYIPGDGEIERDSQVHAEVIYSGGGNFVVLFEKKDQARRFARILSQRVIRKAPGLHLNLYTMQYEWDDGTLGQAVSDVKRGLSGQRSQYPPHTELAGLGVTAVGASNSMPAVWLDMKKQRDGKLDTTFPVTLYSAETMAKRNAVNMANDRLMGIAPLNKDLEYPMDFDELGRSEGERSFVAVVHIDGNNMGLIFQGLAGERNNREYITETRRYSENVKQVASKTLNATVNQLQSCIEHDKSGRKFIAGINNQAQLTIDGGFVPFRPIVFGGDDITFVCDGRIGIALAVIFMSYFEKFSAEVLNHKLTAGAGISIVSSHYPFARAYELAEDLIGNAKALLHRVGKSKSHSAIDWHFTTGGLYGDIDEIRSREYEVDAGHLTLRPLLLGVEDIRTTPNSWNLVELLTTKFQSGDWRTSRNKAKGLMSALRQGRAETIRFRKRYLSETNDPKLPKVSYTADGKNKSTTAGWIGDQCVYFDALELMDLYVPLATQREVNDG